MDTDIEPWLELRNHAFSRERPGVRGWSAVDFTAEFLEKPWWSPESTWLAVAGPKDDIIGAVTLAMRGDPPTGIPVVHWLAVSRAWRRRGVGQLLMQALERRVWDDGYRLIALETHAGWTAAVEFYLRLGYTQAPTQSLPADREPAV